MDLFSNEVVAQYKTAVEQKLLTAIKGSNPKSLYDPLHYITDAGGKKLRPILLLMACEAVGGDPEDALDAAVAVEILHTFTLVHDDIMDGDSFRRGKETVHKKWDEPTAILAGDALFVFAYQSLLRTKTDNIVPMLEMFNKGILGVCEGQALDMELASREKVSNPDYIEMIEKKTGILLAMASGLGALIGSADEETVQTMMDFGLDLGRAFQLQDDLLEMTSTQSAMGKSLGSDLKEGKKTFLLVNAMNLASDSQRKMMTEIINKYEITRSDMTSMREIFEEIGVIDLTNKQIIENINLAKSRLESLPEGKRENLKGLADLVLKRKK